MNDPLEKLQCFLDNYLDSKQLLRILEAGCGSASHFNFKQQIHLTGIDISEEQLRRNKQLHETILGDTQYYNFSPSSFDVIICWSVLEHLEKPELALKQFATAIKKDGLIVLEIPNVYSIKGIITKFTPMWFHKFYYRHILGRGSAGKNETGPFKTYLRLSMAPNAIKKFANENGLKVVYYETVDVGDRYYWQHKGYIVRFMIKNYNLLRRFIKYASLGTLGDSDIIVVISK